MVMQHNVNRVDETRQSETSTPTVYLRWASALILAPVALASGWIGGWPFNALVMLLAAIMAFEWSRLVTQETSWVNAAIIAIAPIMSVVICYVSGPVPALISLGIGAIVTFLYTQYRGRKSLWLCLGVAYIGLPAISIIVLRNHPEYGRALLLSFFFIAWATDSSAYLAGKLIGGPKLIPDLSPSKTWSGSIGAMLGGGAFALFSALINQVSPLLLYLFFGFLIALLVQLGDLLESSLKRRFDAKDTGGLIPGHGGVMDRLDGLVFASIFVAAAVQLFEFFG